MSLDNGLGMVKTPVPGVVGGAYTGTNKSESVNIPVANYSKRQFLATPLLMTVDCIALCISIIIAYVIRVNFLPLIFNSLPRTTWDFVFALWWLPMLVCMFFIFEKAYTRRVPFWQEAGQIVKTTTLAFLAAISFVFLTKQGDENSRTLVLLAWIISLFLVPALRYFSKRLLFKAHIWERPVIILGAGDTGKLILKAFYQEPFIGYKPIGFLDDDLDKQKFPPELPTGEKIPVLGGFDAAEAVLEKSRVRDIIVAAPGLTGKKLVQLVNKLQRKTYNLLVVPDLFGMAMEGVEIQHLFNEKTLVLKLKNNLNDRSNLVTKTIFEFIVSIILFVLLIPLMLVLAIAIKIDSRGTVFFSDTRIGKEGTEFKCYKFRTMYPDADRILAQYLKANDSARRQWDKYAKLRDYDPRVTRVGGFLRRFSLDELPQIINVIKGDMSLVGPRPYLPREKEKMLGREDILVTKPGITGLWQVSGRNDVEFNERLRLDVWYIRNWSLWLDITILMRTVAVVLRGKGAY
ncbi:undecaprenyl-phosphate galactose phosphotransferase WbaP [Desulfallas thermosapovorans]|uniref:Undecaprenyl-phosphate galactose phosphotransferase n=1 Tax=Desulfallas thermosapovorans DSM 6562 TaxID=1121431 RepID=A0A5S4ZWJ5_9FIRM|nr:undecaprenyl-phosphate galactose phosphotransferase WbaP [Desulfallas thermosapovorans]TYO96586.1 undecaprenyl-phosphate galactose phosphotransferase [Desulfallas thermosapovorans DSM 6562]